MAHLPKKVALIALKDFPGSSFKIFIVFFPLVATSCTLKLFQESTISGGSADAHVMLNTNRITNRDKRQLQPDR